MWWRACLCCQRRALPADHRCETRTRFAWRRGDGSDGTEREIGLANRFETLARQTLDFALGDPAAGRILSLRWHHTLTLLSRGCGWLPVAAAAGSSASGRAPPPAPLPPPKTASQKMSLQVRSTLCAASCLPRKLTDAGDVTRSGEDRGTQKEKGREGKNSNSRQVGSRTLVLRENCKMLKCVHSILGKQRYG